MSTPGAGDTSSSVPVVPTVTVVPTSDVATGDTTAGKASNTLPPVSSAPAVEPPKEAPKKRGRKPRVLQQAEALATSPGPGGKCVDPDCPTHGEGRAPRKCIETGADIWPRMSEKEAITLTREML